MAVWVSDPWEWGQGGLFADQVHTADHPEKSQLLGPDGQALPYARPRVGFDLSRRARGAAPGGSENG